MAMSSEALRTVRDRFSEFIDRVQKHHERVIVTRNGVPAAVLISPEDLESLEETLVVLGNAEAVAEMVEAHRLLGVMWCVGWRRSRAFGPVDRWSLRARCHRAGSPRSSEDSARSGGVRGHRLHDRTAPGQPEAGRGSTT